MKLDEAESIKIEVLPKDAVHTILTRVLKDIENCCLTSKNLKGIKVLSGKRKIPSAMMSNRKFRLIMLILFLSKGQKMHEF